MCSDHSARLLYRKHHGLFIDSRVTGARRTRWLIQFDWLRKKRGGGGGENCQVYTSDNGLNNFAQSFDTNQFFRLSRESAQYFLSKVAPLRAAKIEDLRSIERIE